MHIIYYAAKFISQKECYRGKFDPTILFSSLSLFSRSSSDFDGVELFKKLIGYISQLLLLATINHKHHALLESCILDFLELVRDNFSIKSLHYQWYSLVLEKAGCNFQYEKTF